MDLTEAEDIKKRWQEDTELYKKDLTVPVNHNGVITHLEPDMLECEVKWAIGLEKISFHSNPKEQQCQSTLKLPHNCTHLAG